MTISSIEDWFDRARTQASQGNLVVVRTDGQFLLLPTVANGSATAHLVAAIEKMIPSTTKRNVAVIGDISWATTTSPTLQVASKAIPFFGLLMGIASVGHSVWIFEAGAHLLRAGCHDADVLIVDDASVPALPTNWKAEAEKVMRNPQVLVHDRCSYQLRIPQPEKVRRELQ